VGGLDGRLVLLHGDAAKLICKREPYKPTTMLEMLIM